MNQLIKIFKALTLAQRIGIAAAVIALIAGLVSFVKWRHESDFRPLFTGMPAEDAAAIVQKLKESGTEHRLAENGSSVLVPAAKLDELRLEMAAAGLPRTGRIGFELFDKANLGVTDFTEHVNYRRALEGELERTIRSLNEVEQARIHITFPKESVFLDSREPAKASVLLSLHAGARLHESNVVAITNLVASSVEGLGPEFVSVVDMRGNLLSRPKKSSPADPSDSDDTALEYKHALERDLSTKVVSTLTPLLGEDHFRVGISADCDFSTSELTDETYDPTRSVMTNSQKSEDLASKPDSAGVPGTSSNLPRPTSRPTSAGSSVSRRTENIAYETSRSVRQVKIPRGVLKRLSASILLDQETHWEGKGANAKRVLSPVTPEKIKAIHDLVAGVIGFSAPRGDQLVIQSLAFEQNLQDEIPAPTAVKPLGQTDEIHRLLKNPTILISAGVTILLVVGLLLFLLTRKKQPEIIHKAANPALAEAEKNDTKELPAQTHKALPQSEETLKIADAAAQMESLRQAVRTSVERDPAMAAGVLRNWIAEADS